jgi:hypothetical protein
MISVRFLHRAEWQARLTDHYGCRPLTGKGKLNTAEWWQTSWGHPFTVPVDAEGRCDEWAVQRLIVDFIKCAPQGYKFPKEE